MNEAKIARLVEAGGKEWQKGNAHRVYFNADFAYKAIGLELNYYKTGNIFSAQLKGEPISNSQAKRIVAGLPIWYYDVNAEKLMREGNPSQVIKDLGLDREIVDAIWKAIDE